MFDTAEEVFEFFRDNGYYVCKMTWPLFRELNGNMEAAPDYFELQRLLNEKARGNDLRSIARRTQTTIADG